MMERWESEREMSVCVCVSREAHYVKRLLRLEPKVSSDRDADRDLQIQISLFIMINQTKDGTFKICMKSMSFLVKSYMWFMAVINCWNSQTIRLEDKKSVNYKPSSHSPLFHSSTSAIWTLKFDVSPLDNRCSLRGKFLMTAESV